MAVTWNASDKSTNITLSGGNLTANNGGVAGTYQSVRANTSFTTGKLYFEWTLQGHTIDGTQNIACGWANSTENLNALLGTDNNGFACLVYNATNALYINSSALYGFPSPGAALGNVLACAFDIPNKKVWYCVNGVWNASSASSSDPNQNLGGQSVSGLLGSSWFPAFSTGYNNGQVTVNFGATPFTYHIPFGFSPVDPTSTQTYAAASKLLAYNVLGPPQNGVSASKVLGYNVLGPPQNAVSASKLLGYVVLYNKPIGFRHDLTGPPRRRRVVDPDFVGSPLALIGVPSSNPIQNYMLEGPPRHRRQIDHDLLGSPQPLIEIASVPIFNCMSDGPPRRRRQIDPEFVGCPSGLLAPRDNINISIIW